MQAIVVPRFFAPREMYNRRMRHLAVNIFDSGRPDFALAPEESVLHVPAEWYEFAAGVQHAVEGVLVVVKQAVGMLFNICLYFLFNVVFSPVSEI